jgi:serine/threonine protein kinase
MRYWYFALQVKTYARQMMRGLAYIHSRRIVHGAISIENVLLASDGTVKLTGLGSAKRLRRVRVIALFVAAPTSNVYLFAGCGREAPRVSN